jgi:hypothetical protein
MSAEMLGKADSAILYNLRKPPPPPAYIEEDDSSGENHLSIDVTRWYNYHCNCVLHENLLPRSHFLIYTSPQQYRNMVIFWLMLLGGASVDCRVLRSRPFLHLRGLLRWSCAFAWSNFLIPRILPQTLCYSHDIRKIVIHIYARYTPVASNIVKVFIPILICKLKISDRNLIRFLSEI